MKKLWSVKELAEVLLCPEAVVRALVLSTHRETRLPCVKAGGEMYFDPEDVCQWFDYTQEHVRQALPKS